MTFQTLISAPAKIKDVPVRYMEGLKFCRGDTIHARIMFTGRPTPTATWKHVNKTLKPYRRVEIKTTNQHSILTIDEADKPDSGIYTFTVENKLGKDMVEIPISVIGECLVCKI